MRTVRGATKLQMRFTLQSRGKGQVNWHALSAPGFGRWLSSDPGVGRYVYTKRVVALFAPASYRTRCASAGSAAAAAGSPRTARPRRPAARPTCVPTCARSAIDSRAGADPEHARYVVPVVNRGKTAAGPFDVVVTRRRRDADARSVARPGARRARAGRGRGPALHGGLDADRRRRSHRRRRRARGGRQPAHRDVPRRPCLRAGTRLYNGVYEDRHPSRVRRGPRALHVRQRVHDPLDQARAPRGDLLRVPPVLHGQAEAGRHGWPRGALPAPRRQAPAPQRPQHQS